MTHQLTRLLSPASIAIVGASEREGSLAASTLRQLQATDYSGRIHLVNPKYQQLSGQACYANLSDLPEVPDLVIYAISGLALEASFIEATRLRVGGIVIYASNYLENDSTPRLTERLKALALESGVPVLGGNSMGFYNYDDRVFVSFDQPPAGRPAGHIGLILHSGSGMTYLANNDARFSFNYVIASAQEINASVADYMDYLLDRPSTRVIAIMLETVRDVPAFLAALEKAVRKNIPVLITKLGRTEKSARLAMSHSGAIIGDHQAFVGLCRRYRVILCNDADEMIVTAMLFGAGLKVEQGELASMLDSGGMREQMIDLAEDIGLPFAVISAKTTAVLASHLESGLEAVNPMDGMGSLSGSVENTYLECGKALLDDDASGMLSFEFEFRDGFSHYPQLFKVVQALKRYSKKPIVLLNSCSYTSVDATAAELTWQGIPVINGINVALRAMRHLLCFSPQLTRKTSPAQAEFDPALLGRWREKLGDAAILDETTSLAMFENFGLPCVQFALADTQTQLQLITADWEYPLVLKTAEPGIAHKSDIGGVKVGLRNQLELQSAYLDLQSRLGGRVVAMPMIQGGVEVSLGMKNDSHYGPMVIVACGGVLIELLDQRSCRMAPVDSYEANAMLDELKLARLLAGLRGQAAVDRAGLVELIVRFSELVMELSDSIAEIDLNPVIVASDGCTIVDALVVTKTV
ncbi:MAG: acyl-CoA synthetase (NDP forming) [Planctomycetota bacterium]|jgi:acyl-CoA synthetase (NDP forming)